MSDEFHLERFGRHVPNILKRQLIANLAEQVSYWLGQYQSHEISVSLLFLNSLCLKKVSQTIIVVHTTMFRLCPIFMGHCCSLTFQGSQFYLKDYPSTICARKLIRISRKLSTLWTSMVETSSNLLEMLCSLFGKQPNLKVWSMFNVC